jgi:hypothetical protein
LYLRSGTTEAMAPLLVSVAVVVILDGGRSRISSRRLFIEPALGFTCRTDRGKGDSKMGGSEWRK